MNQSVVRVLRASTGTRAAIPARANSAVEIKKFEYLRPDLILGRAQFLLTTSLKIAANN
jgi:hypothetical protein